MVCIVSVLFAGPINVKAVETYKVNLSAVPHKLSAKNFSKCGISMGVDRRWDSKINGSNYSFSARGYWKKYGGMGHKFVVETPIMFDVQCSSSKARDKPNSIYLKVYAEGYRKAANKGNRRSSRVKTVNYPGLGESKVIYIVRKNRDGSVSDVAELLSLHKGKVINIRLNIGRTPGRRYSQRFSSGKIYSYNDDGSYNHKGKGDFKIRVTSQGRKSADGSLAYARTKSQNMKVFNTILRTVRGL